jgi:hypothetical protein
MACLKSKSKLCYARQSVGQSVLVSGTHLGPRAGFLLPLDSCVFIDMDILCDAKTGLSFTIATGPRQHSNSGVRVPRDS